MVVNKRNNRRKIKSSKKKLLLPIIGLIVIAIIIVLTVFVTIDYTANQIIYKDEAGREYKFTLAPKINFQNIITIDDASNLDKTTLFVFYQPTSVDEIKQIILDTRQKGKKISISGIRHSMGGQAFQTNAVQIDMTKFDEVSYNDDSTITVQSGATWQQIQKVLNKHARSVAVMQDSNIFTLGGAISVNAHGKDPRFGTLISTINYIKLINSEGKEIKASRIDNPDLFKSIIGGYGLFGVITEVNLNTTDNTLYSFDLEKVTTKKLLNIFEDKIKDPVTELVEASFI